MADATELARLPESSFGCILVEINPAFDGHRHIANWLVCHEAVKRADAHVIVVVSPATPEAPLDFAAFRTTMKTTYSVLWDAARVFAKLHMQFTVLGDVPTHGARPREIDRRGSQLTVADLRRPQD